MFWQVVRSASNHPRVLSGAMNHENLDENLDWNDHKNFWCQEIVN